MRKIFSIIYLLPVICFSQSVIYGNYEYMNPNQSPIIFKNFMGTYAAPQAGTLLHIVGQGDLNQRMTVDSYNGMSAKGPVTTYRRARGTATSPSYVLANDIIGGITGNGWSDSFADTALASVLLRAETDFSSSSSLPTYLSFRSSPVGGTGSREVARLSSAGALRLNTYTAGFLKTDASGNVTADNTTYLTPTGSAAALTNFPTLNQNTTGTSANITATSNSTLTTLSSLALPETQITTTDNTTNNVSSTKHGFAPKGDGATTKFLNANGAYSVPTGVNSTITFLGADVTNNNAVANVLADVTGLSFAVTAGSTYKFRFFIVYTSAATTTGSRWTVLAPTLTFLNYRSQYTLTATSETVNSGLGAISLPAAANASSLLLNNIAIVEGIVKPSLNGTVQLQFASEISSSAIVAKAGQSFVEWQLIN